MRENERIRQQNEWIKQENERRMRENEKMLAAWNQQQKKALSSKTSSSLCAKCGKPLVRFIYSDSISIEIFISRY
jgi:hypothetical protein